MIANVIIFKKVFCQYQANWQHMNIWKSNGVMSFPWYGDSHYLSLDIDKPCLYITAGVSFLY